MRRTRTHTHTLPLSTSLCENKQAMSWVAQGQTPADNKAIHPPRALLLLPLHRRKRSAHSSQGVGGVHSASTHATVAVLSISLLRVFPSQHTHTLSISLLRVFHPPPHIHTHTLSVLCCCVCYCTELTAAGRAAKERLARSQQPKAGTAAVSVKAEARRQLEAEEAALHTRPATATTPSREELVKEWRQEADRLQVRVTCPICGTPIRERERKQHLWQELSEVRAQARERDMRPGKRGCGGKQCHGLHTRALCSHLSSCLFFCCAESKGAAFAHVCQDGLEPQPA